MSTFRSFEETGYSPGGAILGPRARGRRAGLASGRRRRQLARARRANARPGQLTESLRYEHRQLSRREYDDRYEATRPRPEWPAAAAQWEKRREAVWRAHMAAYALVCARGQHVRTTNGQRAVALSSRGLARCRRSIQRYHRDLEQLGIATFSHVRKAAPAKDCLCVEWRVTRSLPKLPVTPPSGTENCGASPHAVLRRTEEIAPAARAVPPDGGGQRQAPSAPGTEDVEPISAERFEQLRAELFPRLRERSACPTPAVSPRRSPPRGPDG